MTAKNLDIHLDPRSNSILGLQGGEAVVLPPGIVTSCLNYRMTFVQMNVKPYFCGYMTPVVCYSTCDGFHVAYIETGKNGEFIGFCDFSGVPIDPSLYVAWAYLPDGPKTIAPVFCAKQKESA